MNEIEINGARHSQHKLINRLSDHGQGVLKNAHADHVEPLCLCVSGGVRMHVAKLNSGIYILKRNPGSADLHNEDCRSFDVVELAESSNSKSPALVESGTLHQTLIQLWYDSRLSFWHPKMKQKRTPYTVPHYVAIYLQKPNLITINADRIYVPQKPAALDWDAAGREVMSDIASIIAKCGEALVLVEAESIKDTKKARRLLTTHFKQLVYLLDESVSVEMPEKEDASRVIFLARVTEASGDVFLKVSELARLDVTLDYLPFSSPEEHSLLNALVASDKHFSQNASSSGSGFDVSGWIVSGEQTDTALRLMTLDEVKSGEAEAFRARAVELGLCPWVWIPEIQPMPSLSGGGVSLTH